MILENLLLEYGATLENRDASEVILSEKKRADFYFQIKTGEVKMYNLNEQGKEFVQGIFMMAKVLANHHYLQISNIQLRQRR